MQKERTHPLRFIVIGAGLSGILAAIKLKEAGYSDITVFEKATRLGGTWRDNIYPGVACDIPSHLYCYSFAPNPEWSQRYAPGGEILGYLEHVARRFDVVRHVRFNTEITRCEFHQDHWKLTTHTGAQHEADVVIAATGVTHHPHIPPLAGLESFAGICTHSARWPQDLQVTNRRIGVIGTGSSAVQVVSAAVKQAAQVTVFQRTPQWIMPQENPPFTEAEKQAFRADPVSMMQKRAGMERKFVQNFSDAVTDVDSPRLQEIEAACRANLESEVKDPLLREQLRPDYRPACKRLVISPDYYRAIQQPNASLITAPIECIEAKGVRTRDGLLHELDVLVLATGFRTDAFIRPTRVIGQYGRHLDDAWSERPVAYLCVAVPEFPNLFFLNGPNGPVGNYPMIEVAEAQMRFLLQLIAKVDRGECVALAPRRESTQAFETARIEQARRTVWTSGCSSWYLDAAGVPAAWPWPIAKFREWMAAPDWRQWEML